MNPLYLAHREGTVHERKLGLVIDEEAYLEHYGVKGMRWGVRRDAYLDSLRKRQTSIKQRKAATFVARAAKLDVRINEINKELDALPPGFRGYRTRSNLKYEGTLLTERRDQDRKKAEKIRNSRLTPMQKKLLIGGLVVGGVVGVAYLANKGVNHEGVAAYFRQQQSLREHGDVFQKSPWLKAEMTPNQILKDVSKHVNPNYASIGGKMNCRRSTFAHELRRRGYNVEATTSGIGFGQSETGLINALIKGDRDIFRPDSLSSSISSGAGARARATVKDVRKNPAFTQSVKRLHDLGSNLVKQGDGARGEVVFDEGEFGHSMAYEVIKGKAYIFDSQKGQMFDADPIGLMKLAEKWGTPNSMEVTRLDNLELDLDFLGRWVRNKG